ncbi:MAG: arginyltransferase, partial [Desulfobulbaceae bacterium]|nr:arginyltransferase [Desulfobulbaceae bacterium]
KSRNLNYLYLIKFCQQKEIKFIYLGYWIEGVNAMSYKARFKPHQIFHDNAWNLVTR